MLHKMAIKSLKLTPFNTKKFQMLLVLILAIRKIIIKYFIKNR